MGLVTRRSEQLDKLFDQFAVDPKKPKANIEELNQRYPTGFKKQD